MHAYTVYRGSSGAMTNRYYGALVKRGPVGVVAKFLFRAQKCSKRAKKYGPYAGVGGSTYRDLAYTNKAESLKKLTEVLGAHGATLGIQYGWGEDEFQPDNKWVLYVDLPEIGQVSFHSPERYDGPDYEGEWDGIRGASEHRIMRFCDSVYFAGAAASVLAL